MLPAGPAGSTLSGWRSRSSPEFSECQVFIRRVTGTLPEPIPSKESRQAQLGRRVSARTIAVVGPQPLRGWGPTTYPRDCGVQYRLTLHIGSSPQKRGTRYIPSFFRNRVGWLLSRRVLRRLLDSKPLACPAMRALVTPLREGNWAFCEIRNTG